MCLPTTGGMAAKRLPQMACDTEPTNQAAATKKLIGEAEGRECQIGRSIDVVAGDKIHEFSYESGLVVADY